ncbi:MAG: hypothetical protein A2Z18_00460 [Armatimonadetes bacterium RBG_16_58_9]|nr:MAG: hypothetical protein A2Z18_00460 [Armatimonadetes bacterium RBG_16_58_9]
MSWSMRNLKSGGSHAFILPKNHSGTISVMLSIAKRTASEPPWATGLSRDCGSTLWSATE